MNFFGPFFDKIELKFKMVQNPGKNQKMNIFITLLINSSNVNILLLLLTLKLLVFILPLFKKDIQIFPIPFFHQNDLQTVQF